MSAMKEFDGLFKVTRFGPWKRGFTETYGGIRTIVNSTRLKFDENIYPNMDIAKEVKIAALKASPSIVSVCTQGDDDDENMYGSGTIINSEFVDGKHIGTVLTSASMLRSGDKDEMKAKIHIHVRLADQKQFEAKVHCCDWHYNIATLSIESTEPFSMCTIKFLDDSISIDPDENLKNVGSSQDPDLFNLVPGDSVIAIGRYWEDSSLMVAPGAFSIDVCGNLDCKELFKADSRITKSGLGGSLLNRHGEVIGLNFYKKSYTPFLAINVVFNCLEYFRTYRKFPHPKLGIVVTNLYATTVDLLEIIFHNFPTVFKGVIVEKVEAGSNAALAGLLPHDVIIKCDGYPVGGVLEFLERIFWKSGESVELTVLRSKDGNELDPKKKKDVYVPLKLSMVIDEMHDLNRWPLRSEFMVPVKRYRKCLA